MDKTEEKKKDSPITPKLRTLIELLMVEFGKVGKKRRTMGSLLLEAGYSPATAKNPKKIFESPHIKEILDRVEGTFQETTKDFIEQLAEKRQMAMEALTDEKMKKSKATELTYIVDTMTKNHQLLSGKDTGRLGLNLDPEEQAEIDNIFKSNKKK